MNSGDAKNLLVLVALLFALLFTATNFGIAKCDMVPFWCEVYYGIVGPPKVLIAYGEDGMGSEERLADALNRYVKAQTGIRRAYSVPVTPVTMPVSSIAEENLKKYNLVIVTHAKTIGIEKLKAFDKYVRGGGRLVWTGDAGTQAPDDLEHLYADELDKNARHDKVGGGWTRVDSDGTRFDFGKEILSSEFIGLYCVIEKCDDATPLVGSLDWSDDPLTAGLAENLAMDRDFALVKQVESSLGGTNIVATVRSAAAVVKEGKNHGRNFPLIVRTGPGIRVAYYALPPEDFIDEEKGRGEIGRASC